MASNVFYQNNKKYNCISHEKPYYRKTATINGKRRYFYGDGEKDTDRKIEEAKQKEAAGFQFDTRKTKVGYAFRHWLFDVKRVDRDIKASTFERYDCIFRNHIEKHPIADTLMCKLNSTAMQAYATNLHEEYGCTGATIQSTIKLWKLFCSWAIEEGYIVKNPCLKISIPGKRTKGKKKIEVFTDEERAKIVDCMSKGYEYDTLIMLAFATGMRQGELLGLRWEDIYDNAIHVKQSTKVVGHIDAEGNKSRYREVWDTKTANSERTIPLTSKTAAMLAEHKRKQDVYFFKKGIRSEYVFTTLTGQLIDASSLRKSYVRLLNRAGVPFRKFHAIRHTFATTAIRRGMDVEDLRELLGHSDIRTTYIYVQSDDESKRKAIELIGDII